MGVVDDAEPAAPVELGDERHAPPLARLQPSPARLPGASPVVRLVAEPKNADPGNREVREQRLAVKGGRPRAPLSQLLELDPEDIVHPERARQLFGHVAVAGAPGAKIDLLED